MPYARNPKQHGEEQLSKMVASLREFGWTFPILIDEHGEVIAGHGRLLAAQRVFKHGWTIPGWEDTGTVPVLSKQGLSENQKRAYRILDNQIAEESDWDRELLSLELDELANSEFNLALTGFNSDEIRQVVNALNETRYLTDEDTTSEPPVQPITRLGDVWIMGKHRLMCGDSTSIDDMAKLTEGYPVDMWLTDPPYNVGYEGGTKDKLTIKNDLMGDEQFRQFLRDAYVAADTVMKSGAVFYIWHSDSEGYNFRGAARDAGWIVRQCLIWKKSSMVLGRQDYHWQHEPCLYGWKEGASHRWLADRKQTTILEFEKPARNGDHPTMKPVALFEYQMLNNTNCGDVVLDSFGGSGTTLIAAEKNGRVARIMELDPKYCDVIIKRWQDFTGKEAAREVDGVTFNMLQCSAANGGRGP